MSKKMLPVLAVMFFLSGIVLIPQCYAGGGVTFDDDPVVTNNDSTTKPDESKNADSEKKDEKSDKNKASAQKEADEENQGKADMEKTKKSDDKKTAAKKDDKEQSAQEEPFELDGALNERFAEIAQQARLSKQKQKKLVMLQVAMGKAVAQYTRKNAMRVASYQRKLSRADDEKDQQKLQKKIDDIEAGKEKVEKSYEIKALKMLDAKETQTRNFAIIWKGVSDDMMMLNVSEEQSKKAEDICRDFAAKSKRPLLEQDTEKANFQVAKKIMDILNKEQETEYKRVLNERWQQLQEEKKSK